MSYSGGFKDIVYADEDRAPRVLKYRIVFVDDGSPAATHAIIHLVQSDAADPPLNFLNAALDAVLNKVVASEFEGVRVDQLHFVFEANGALVEYPIDFSAEDFRKRGNPVVVQGSGKNQSIHIDSRDVVGGSVSLFAVPAKQRGLPQILADALS
jgi:hypothetical protein